MPSHRCLAFCAAILSASSSGLAAQTIGGLPKADAERMVQGYLSMWSTDAGINEASVSRFYAPRVIYYGKAFSRAQVLEDKRAYIREWPERTYRESPGSLRGACNADRSLCEVSFQMTWRRTSRAHVVSIGRARVSFDFVPVEGRRKIARESARIL